MLHLVLAIPRDEVMTPGPRVRKPFFEQMVPPGLVTGTKG
jgi:hypothetical protein